MTNFEVFKQSISQMTEEEFVDRILLGSPKNLLGWERREDLVDALRRNCARTHILKIQHRYWTEIDKGNKTFEVRKNDRSFKVGDLIKFSVLGYYGVPYPAYCDTGECAMGNHKGFEDKNSYRITYILDDRSYCKRGYVILGIKKVEDEKCVKRKCGFAN